MLKPNCEDCHLAPESRLTFLRPWMGQRRSELRTKEGVESCRKFEGFRKEPFRQMRYLALE